ncbi:hypothetical protein GQX74_014527 [Glossina fuscipes]|nr:hypothetical protein GQX74_014527 [Glossina fuscipes]
MTIVFGHWIRWGRSPRRLSLPLRFLDNIKITRVKTKNAIKIVIQVFLMKSTNFPPFIYALLNHFGIFLAQIRARKHMLNTFTALSVG